MARTLQLNFETTGGKKMMLTVDEPRADLTAQEVDIAMEEIISAGVFVVDDLPLNSKINARIIERTVSHLIE